jgi:protein O-GlcNAc transferase
VGVNLAAGREALLRAQPAVAAPLFAADVELDPLDCEARYWLASALLLLGEPVAAEEALNDARTLHALAAAEDLGSDIARLRSDPAYADDEAYRFYRLGYVAMASVAWGLAISAGDPEGRVWANFALCLHHQGRVEEAASVYQMASETLSIPEVDNHLVYAQLFCQDGERRHAAAARAWADVFAKIPPPPPHTNRALSGRRLRVGYVAPNFAGTQLRQFIAPLLENHDPEAVEVVLYPAEAASEADWPGAIKAHPIGHLNDAEAAAMIRNDGIDILNDCWGHAAGGRLGVFARKPAPVQAAWINFFQTTGLPQMDYVLHAAIEDAPDFRAQFTEDLWRLGPVFTAFRPASGRLAPGPTPARATGKITFASFNHPAKLSPDAISAWAAVLRVRPDSELLLKYRYFADPVMQQMMRMQFAARGVEPERIVFGSHTIGEDYFKSFQAVDLMLDTWPAPGSTTTLEALSNGVPVLAMVGDPPNVGGVYARTILRAAGLGELATTSAEAFVDLALSLTGDLDRLDALRARVRPGFEASAFCDEVGFTRGLERAYGEMFERWRSRAVAKFALGSI